MSSDPVVNANIDQYLTAMWIQTDENEITNWYKAVDCTEVFSDNEILSSLENKKCPQMDGN